MNILLVDDRPANLLALEAILDGLGENLVRAASGDEALRLLGERDFAVVLLDVQMPGLNGFQTAQRVRASDRSRHTPIIFLSADESPEFPVAEAYRLGAVDYLIKPLIPDILRSKVAVFVDLFRKGERLRDLERRERERAEEALRETERRFERFMEHLPGLAWIKDRAGRYLYANDAAERAFGARRTELYGRADGEVFPPETAARFRANDLVAAESPGGIQVVESLIQSDGVTHFSLVNKFAIPGADGQPALVGGVAIDVTDRMRAEAALQMLAEAGEAVGSSLDPEAQLSAVARLVVPRMADWCSVYLAEPGGRLRPVVVAHADPAKVSWGQELAARYPPDPAAPQGIPAVVRSGQPEFIAEVTDEMIATAARDADHLALLRGLGVRSVMIVPLCARDRTLGAITFVAAESGRRYAEADLALAVDVGRRAGLAVDNARLFQQSQETSRLLGLLVEAAERLTGTLDPPAVRAAILDLSHRLVAADAYAIWRLDPDKPEWAVAVSDGLSEAYLKAEGHVPVGKQGAPQEPIVAEDVRAAAALESRRRAYEAEGIESLLAVPLRTRGQVTGTLVFYYRTRQRFNDLTIRVATALAGLAGAALGTADLYARESESRRRAEEADRSKGEFIAMLAHELRNPLAPIRNALEIVRLSGADPAVVTKVHQMMDRQVTHLGRLVDDLLDVSRITSGKVHLRTSRLDLGLIARQSVADYQAEFDTRGLGLRTEVEGAPVWVTGDATRLAQVLDNLLTNALKFTPRGGEVVVSVARGPGRSAVLSVRDSGAGIEPDTLARLFEPFSQADRTLDRSAGGLGLGLAIVKGLAALHGGTVRAESAGLGRGSTFTLTLPAEDEPPALAGPPVPAHRAARALRVLVVEDNRDAADSLRMLLEAYGYEVEVAYTGPDGVRAAERYRPEVVICDIGLPGMDGYEVAGAVRRNPATAAARLIALTGYGQDEDRRRAQEAGFDHHLTKPADPVALESLLSSASDA